MFSCQQLNLMKSSNHVGVLSLTGKADKRQDQSFISGGMNAIIQDGNFQAIYTTPATMDQYEYTLLSLTSCTDILTAVNKLPQSRKTKIIVGGSGCINIAAIKDLVDIVNYGRCDGLINDIIDGYRDNSTIDTVNVSNGVHIVRQATKLYDTEVSIGCKYNCKFCQYTNVRRLQGNNYHHGRTLHTYEDNFIDFRITGPGRYTTAFDGISQNTRYLVGKPISDELIIEKLSNIIASNYNKTTTIKIFNIVGYPWETPESIADDLGRLQDIFHKIDRNTQGNNGRIFAMMMFTPFSPEPLTPMALMPANVLVNWREVLDKFGRGLYKSDRIEVMVLPQVNSPLTLLKRVLVNRGASYETLRTINSAAKPKELSWNDYMPWIIDKYNLDQYIGWQERDINLATYKKIHYITRQKVA